MAEAVNNEDEPKTEIEPLADEALEDVAGGMCSWAMCSFVDEASVDG